MQPLKEQLDIISAAAEGRSLAVYACAGAGKTTTIKLLAPSLPRGRHLAVAFNKRIAVDLQAALPQSVRAATLNALGHRAWMQQRGGKLLLEAYKMNDLVRDQLRDMGLYEADEDGSFSRFLSGLADRLRQANAVPPGAKRPVWTPVDWETLRSEILLEDYDFEELCPFPEAFAIVQRALEASIELAFKSTIDFLDQIYMTTSWNAAYDTYHTVIVDEAQDLSPANHRQLMLLRPKQLIAVGDPKQAIYAFRGADSSSMDSLRQLWQSLRGNIPPLMEVFPLATSFRCPKAIVERQKAHYPEMTAFDSNPEGTIERHEKWTLSDVPYGAAVICRNTAPLVSFAFLCLSQSRGFTFLGQDMAKNLKSLIKKIAGFTGKNLTKGQKTMPRDALLSKTSIWFENELSILRARKRTELEAGLRDRHQCALMLISKSENLGKALDLADTIFASQEAGLTICTGHRSKGFEWDHVFHLDPWRIPSRYAREAAEAGDLRQLQQEKNLRYVIETRAKASLHFISLQDNADIKDRIDE